MKSKFVNGMITAAYYDLDASDSLISRNNLGLSVLHSQQCVEKSFKAFMAFSDVSFGSDHDIRKLCKKAEKINASFSAYRDICTRLSAEYLSSHYPDYEGDLKVYDLAVVQEYNRVARSIYTEVCGILNRDVSS